MVLGRLYSDRGRVEIEQGQFCVLSRVSCNRRSFMNEAYSLLAYLLLPFYPSCPTHFFSPGPSLVQLSHTPSTTPFIILVLQIPRPISRPSVSSADSANPAVRPSKLPKKVGLMGTGLRVRYVHHS